MDSMGHAANRRSVRAIRAMFWDTCPTWFATAIPLCSPFKKKMVGTVREVEHKNHTAIFIARTDRIA
jgi:hypothetical protein